MSAYFVKAPCSALGSQICAYGREGFRFSRKRSFPNRLLLDVSGYKYTAETCFIQRDHCGSLRLLYYGALVYRQYSCIMKLGDLCRKYSNVLQCHCQFTQENCILFCTLPNLLDNLFYFFLGHSYTKQYLLKERNSMVRYILFMQIYSEQVQTFDRLP